jgi:hypothetical protein
MESYLKFTFSRDILVFAMAWMGTRDIYIAAFIMIVFSIMVDYILNEDSQLCCLPKSFTGYHIEKLENMTPTPEEIEKAKKILEQVGVGEPTVPPNPLGGTNSSPSPPPSRGTVGPPSARTP